MSHFNFLPTQRVSATAHIIRAYPIEGIAHWVVGIAYISSGTLFGGHAYVLMGVAYGILATAGGLHMSTKRRMMEAQEQAKRDERIIRIAVQKALAEVAK